MYRYFIKQYILVTVILHYTPLLYKYDVLFCAAKLSCAVQYEFGIKEDVSPSPKHINYTMCNTLAHFSLTDAWFN